MPSDAWASRISVSVLNGTSAASFVRSAAGKIGHLLVAVRAVGRPAPDLPGAERRLAFEHRVQECEIHDLLWWQPHAAGQVPRARRRRLAARAERMIAEGRVTVDGAIVADPARDVDDDRAIAVNGEPVTGAERRGDPWMLNKPPGVISTARDPGGQPDGDGRSCPRTAPAVPGGPARRRTTPGAPLTNDGELANPLLHPSSEVPRTYRATVRRPPCARRRWWAARRVSARGRADRAGAWPAGERRRR